MGQKSGKSREVSRWVQTFIPLWLCLFRFFQSWPSMLGLPLSCLSLRRVFFQPIASTVFVRTCFSSRPCRECQESARNFLTPEDSNRGDIFPCGSDHLGTGSCLLSKTWSLRRPTHRLHEGKILTFQQLKERKPVTLALSVTVLIDLENVLSSYRAPMDPCITKAESDGS
jgi:hypothetical protein